MVRVPCGKMLLPWQTIANITSVGTLGSILVSGDARLSNSVSSLTSSTGNFVFYRQIQQPVIWRATFTLTPQNSNFAGASFNVSNGPYVADATQTIIAVSNGDHPANTGFWPYNATAQQYISNQLTKISLSYTCNNTNTARVNFAVIFTPR